MAQTPMDPKDDEPGDLVVESKASDTERDLTGPIGLEPDELVGRTILDRYQILQRIGEGGMGAVYLALHTIIEKKVVLKVLHGEYGRKPELVERFLHEAKTASKIRHENVVDITDFGQIPGGTVFIAMEYLKGHDLADHIKENGSLKWKQVKPIALQICAALEEAHNVGVVHRDLKPENIFLIKRGARNDFVKILDFGIAKMTELDASGRRLTRTGMVFGTPEYMAPEQARGENTDRRVDVYAMGCILYEMMCGDVPFRAGSFMGVLTKHIFDPVVRPTERYPELKMSSAVEAVILKALDKDKDRRYQSMAELAAGLEAVDSPGAAQAAAAARAAASGSQPAMKQLIESAATVPTSAADVRAELARMGATAAADPDDSLEWQPPKRTGLKVVAALLGLAIAAGGVFFYLKSRKSKDGDAGAASGSGSGSGSVAAAGGDSPSASASPTQAPVASPSASESPAPSPMPDTVKISIVTTPPGATVRRGTQVEGQTPLTLTLDRGGPQQLQIEREGYQQTSLEVSADKDREYVMTLDEIEKPSPSPVVKKGGGKKGGGKKGGGKKGGSDEIKDPFGP